MTNKGRTWKLQKKNLMKFAIFMFAVMLMVGWNYVSFRVVAQGDFNLFDNPATTNSLPEITNPTTQVDYIVDPPLGNSTSLPGFTTVFSLMALNLPVQIIFVFLAEVLMGTALKLDPKRLNIKRLGIMIGSALALTVVVSLVYYLMVWPAMHDLAIHNQGTFNDPITEEQNILQYGGAQTFFTKGVDILLLVFAMIFIMGFNFLAFKFIQRLTYLTSALSIAYPLVYFVYVDCFIVLHIRLGVVINLAINANWNTSSGNRIILKNGFSLMKILFPLSFSFCFVSFAVV
ncbi:MAG: hypothetical protein ACTSSK_07175, partial [Candidatus Heimdallarchaeota archaeon]